MSKNTLFSNILILTVLLFVTRSASSASVRAAAPSMVKALIGFERVPGPAEQALVRNFGGEIKYSYHLVPAIAATVPEAALQGLRHSPMVTVVERDLQVHIADAELDNAWGVKRIGAGAVHARGVKGAGVKVGILDTGIDTDHPDLDYDPSCSENFINPGTPPEDGNSHGTHVAGILAAIDNEVGVVGVAPEATLCIYKVFDDSGEADYSDIIAALQRAVTDGVQVTNHSYGDTVNPGLTVKAAFDETQTAGLIHVAAAGNNGDPWGILNICLYPALWDSVIAVGATTQSDAKDFFSSTCNELELAAPGTSVNSTMPGGGYGLKSGTSMASPHAAGAAALVLAAGWDRDQVRARLQSTADDLGAAGRDRFFGFGLVDADEATSQPTAVTIASFSANQQGGAIILSWETILETGLLGFNVYRSEFPDGDLLRLNPELIGAAAFGDLSGSKYAYYDSTVQPGVTYDFWLEVIEADRESRLGPVSVTTAFPIYLPVVVH
jgi:subtilisin